MAELDSRQFRAGCARLLRRSRQLGDGWQWRQVGADRFLVRETVVPAPPPADDTCDIDSDDGETDSAAVAACPSVWLLEHHVALSSSYGVPLLLMTGRDLSGRPLEAEQVWRLAPAEHADHLRRHGWATLSLLEHPVLRRLFLAVHPCHTARLMAQATAADRSEVVIGGGGEVPSCGGDAVAFSDSQSRVSDVSVCADQGGPRNSESSDAESQPCGTVELERSVAVETAASDVGTAVGQSDQDRTNGCELDDTGLCTEQEERAYRYLILWLSMFGPICGLTLHEAYAF
ncbi:ubiquitin-like-conjugating enzyme ATG10 [Amphibalanus amphitrite]|uniref:ubiquitin-like-conjugating enzyme ATG10 n=1 Tax=Amphibalanus amphitrite TaxID=1232801 RepID=UPI001C9281D1|nr:ubiquitin-like-conjugating enzyme ATG10 [Amphibalanus amphitrite]